MSGTDRTLLAFDGRVDCGSPEHFFHFLWGYLLPAVRLCHEAEARDVRRRYAVRSCGPVMDPVLVEMCTTLRMDVVILPRELQSTWRGPAVGVPRWDLALLWMAMRDAGGPRSDRMHRLRTDIDRHPTLRRDLDDPALPDRLAGNIAVVRQRLLAATAQVAAPPGLADRVLLLRRSPQPRYYDEGGPAEIPRYGAGRRAFTNLEVARDELVRRGVPAEVFEPGACSLAEQAGVFRDARGVVAIRGAELANLVWMTPGRPVVVVTPADMRAVPPPHAVLCRLLGLDLRSLECGAGVNQEVDVDAVAQALTR